MSRRMRFLTAAHCLVLAGLTAPSVASAQEFSGEIGIATENVAKGLGKSGGDPSASASFEAGHGDFYAGVSGSTVDIAQGADVEIIATVGYAPKIGAYKFDFSALHRTLSGAPAGYDDQFMEYQADVSRDVGPVGVRMRINYSPDTSGPTGEAWWLEAQGSMAIDASTRASIAVGQRITDGSTAYVAWNAGVKRKLTDRLALDVRWYDTDRHSLGERYEGRLVGALSLSF